MYTANFKSIGRCIEVLLILQFLAAIFRAPQLINHFPFVDSHSIILRSNIYHEVSLERANCALQNEHLLLYLLQSTDLKRMFF
jgi:hypothetical protein